MGTVGNTCRYGGGLDVDVVVACMHLIDRGVEEGGSGACHYDYLHHVVHQLEYR